MWIKQPGAVTERIEFLGLPEFCSYLVRGDKYALVGGGMAHIIPDLLAQLHSLNVDLERIQYLIIGHSHYDHVGIAPYLARQWPWLKVAISDAGASILTNMKALEVLQKFNNALLAEKRESKDMEPMDLLTDGFPVHLRLSDGMELGLGAGMNLRIIEAPGHSVCSLASYCPKERALFPSDSIGGPIGLKRMEIVSFGSSNYDHFQETIEKICGIKAQIICFEHFGAFTLPESVELMNRAGQNALDFRRKMVETLRQKGDLEITVDTLADELYEAGLSEWDFLPEDLLKSIIRRMVLHVTEPGKADRHFYQL